MSRQPIFNRKPLIYLITEGAATAENFFSKKTEILSLIKTAVESKISLVQIREKNLPARLVFELAAEAAKITNRTATKILINDRADLALAAGADGVHLTGRSLPAKIVRDCFPPNFIIGVSAHSLAEVENARDAAVDFATFSPIFPTPSKIQYGAPQGLEKLREVCEKLADFPVIALGDVDGNNYESVLASGARGFAAIRFLNDAEKLKKLAADLRR